MPESTKNNKPKNQNTQRIKSIQNLLKNRESTLRYEIGKSITKTAALPDVRVDVRKRLLHLDGFCEYCRKNEAVTLDHFNPVIKDGLPTGYCNDTWNMVPACSACNSSKGNRNCLEWMRGEAKKNPCVGQSKSVKAETIRKWKQYAAACEAHCVKAIIDHKIFQRINSLISIQMTMLQNIIDQFSKDYRIDGRTIVYGEDISERLLNTIDKSIKALCDIKNITDLVIVSSPIPSALRRSCDDSEHNSFLEDESHLRQDGSSTGNEVSCLVPIQDNNTTSPSINDDRETSKQLPTNFDTDHSKIAIEEVLVSKNTEKNVCIVDIDVHGESMTSDTKNTTSVNDHVKNMLLHSEDGITSLSLNEAT